MGLNIKNQEVERLASEVAEAMGSSKTEAIRRALEEKRDRLAEQGQVTKAERVRRALEEIWAQIPPEVLGKTITKAEREEILGYGPDGV
jgi:antitoxin VapB